MTLDEAIEHAEEVSSQCSIEDQLCSQNHIQLARWLRELKKYREIYGDIYGDISDIAPTSR
ncbi:MAG: hypothetical protein HC877_23910 [Thioploca sp.]|nr:hypothetical protein [Thioploca sp.]